MWHGILNGLLTVGCIAVGIITPNKTVSAIAFFLAGGNCVFALTNRGR